MNVVRLVRSALLVLLAVPLALFLRFVRHRGQPIWLVGERKNQACDNGFHFFRHVRTQHPGDPAFYVITRDSPHRDRVLPFRNVVYFGELRHYAYWLAAACLVCAHLRSCVPEGALCWALHRLLRGWTPMKRIYLKHGITKEKQSCHVFRASGFDLYVCGAQAEADFVSAQFGYPPGGVRYLGLPRFDALPHRPPTKRQILFMPTWRKWFSITSSWGRVDDASRDQFLNSAYYQNLRQVLDDSSLQQSLEAADHRLIFYAHHELQPTLRFFTAGASRVVIARPEDHDPQTLLVDSAILVTDYSSVAFDFAYMGKPLIYFQFDRAEYDRSHYEPGYFDYPRDGFGPVVATPAAVVAELTRRMLGKSCPEEEEYAERARRFFTFRDTNNCGRVYQAIRELCP